MFRADDPTASGGEYTEGTPGVSVPTRLRADALNAIQNEIANAIELMGETLSKPDSDQLGQILKARRLQDLKLALGSFRTVEDTATSETITGMARRASDRIISAVGTTASVQVLNTSTMAFGAGSVSDSYTGDFQAVCYDSSFNKFFACGQTGEIQASSNGSAYTRASNGGATLNSIASRNGSGGGDSVVAVGGTELIRFSLNGTSFSTGTSPFAGTPNITSVICPLPTDGTHLGYWCCTDTGDIAYSSNDGSTWTVELATAGSTLSGSLHYHESLGLFYLYGGSVYHSTGNGTWTQIHNAVGTSSALLVLQDCWFVQNVVAAPCSLQGRTTLDVNSDAEFCIEFLGHSGTPFVMDGQLWAFSSDIIYAGGAV